jgi:hypothetical protein
VEAQVVVIQLRKVENLRKAEEALRAAHKAVLKVARKANAMKTMIKQVHAHLRLRVVHKAADLLKAAHKVARKAVKAAHKVARKAVRKVVRKADHNVVHNLDSLVNPGNPARTETNKKFKSVRKTNGANGSIGFLFV